jgi:hypothetical protein
MGAFGAAPELEPDRETIRLCRLTRSAHDALIQEDFALALSRYREILAEFPDDTVSHELVRRLSSIESAPRSSFRLRDDWATRGAPHVVGQSAPDNSPQQVSAALRPSEYTAALIQVLRARAAWVRGANALEIG